MKPKPVAEARALSAPAASADLLDFDGPPTAPTVVATALPPSTTTTTEVLGGGGGGKSVRSESYAAASSTTTGYYATDYAAAPGALVVAAPSAGYMGYNSTSAVAAAVTENPYHTTANPFGGNGGNPYDLPAPASQNLTQPYQYQPAAAVGVVGNAANHNYNPYAIPAPAPAAVNPYAAPAVANPYAAPAPAVANPYEVQPPSAANPYKPEAANPYTAPAPAANPYEAPVPEARSSWTPPHITTQLNPYDSMQVNPYGSQNGAVPPAVTPQEQQTPSSLGFGSPLADFSGFSPVPKNRSTDVQQQPPAAGPPFFAPTNSLSGAQDQLADGGFNGSSSVPGQQQQPRSMVDEAYAKLANLDTFSIVSKKDSSIRSNPFENPGSSTVGGNKSLADMRNSKVSLSMFCGMKIFLGSLLPNMIRASLVTFFPCSRKWPRKL